jgi:hypothetical protein
MRANLNLDDPSDSRERTLGDLLALFLLDSAERAAVTDVLVACADAAGTGPASVVRAQMVNAFTLGVWMGQLGLARIPER